MKKFVYRTLFFLSAGMFSCQDFLDTTPKDFISPVNYFRNEQDINTILNGVYDPLGRLYSRLLWFEADVADQMFDNRSWVQVDLSFNSFDASDTKVTSLWDNLYDGINRANVLLANLDKADMSAEKKKVVRGEAKFLRAYYYFLLVTHWGDVPFKTEPSASVVEVNIPRTPSKVIYDFIAKEMEEAEGMVNPITAYTYNSRVTKSVVQGILARVYLKMAGAPLKDVSKYADALKWALKVRDNGAGHSLNPSYANVFVNHARDIYDLREGIWEVEFNKGSSGRVDEEGNLGNTNGLGTTNEAIGYSYSSINVLKSHFDLYQPALQVDSINANGTINAFKILYSPDTRRDWNIAPYTYVNNSGTAKRRYTTAQIYNRKNAKWRREYETALPKSVNTTSINFPILRYADVLLMIAEAENEVNGPTSLAHEAINLVRRRAYGKLAPNASKPEEYDLKGLDKTDMKLAIKDERSKELFSEGLRKFDLVRWGDYLVRMRSLASEVAADNTDATTKASAIKTANNTSERNLLLPIPLREMSLNSSITQNNPGW
ncbi:RagB/SusD family nutrient uptake outer membrane protein [Rufibacter glacialis]|uniref:RagB/SusD family nutrient uptake outer membrane protein n=1 Tax=Rufibacter glacialis TaxID=1259555 RepID=A0A5M8QGZ7_9BACT|nr:RagB/SusD family nutrient uptake outer membrane protein [Rufibacter glacialis]KAA6435335.1 RagB/SusD family nutrient uptake outer membrane protein [Rufibacter glacialis]GGK62450.1 starch-binding protein [Rufibacter glacialis]